MTPVVRAAREFIDRCLDPGFIEVGTSGGAGTAPGPVTAPLGCRG